MNDRFKFRVITKKAYKTINGTFKGQRIFYCNGFIQTRLKTYFFGDNKRLSFLNSEVEAINQCTGLKDKNGKLIYEGDILGGTYGNLYVHYCDRCKQFQLKANDYGCLGCEGDIDWWELVESEDENELEVIGNIYENKELLESEG